MSFDVNLTNICGEAYKNMRKLVLQQGKFNNAQRQNRTTFLET